MDSAWNVILLKCLSMSTHISQPARDPGLEESFQPYPVAHVASCLSKLKMPPRAMHTGTGLFLNPVGVRLTLPIGELTHSWYRPKTGYIRLHWGTHVFSDTAK